MPKGLVATTYVAGMTNPKYKNFQLALERNEENVRNVLTLDAHSGTHIISFTSVLQSQISIFFALQPVVLQVNLKHIH